MSEEDTAKITQKRVQRIRDWLSQRVRRAS